MKRKKLAKENEPALDPFDKGVFGRMSTLQLLWFVPYRRLCSRVSSS